MADNEALPSIIEYSDELSNQVEPKPLPVGSYRGVVRGAEIKTSAKTGGKYVAVKFFVSPDQYPADYTDGNPDGTTLDYMRLSPANEPQARWGMKLFCEAIGVPAGRSLDLTTWNGADATVKIKQEVYEGRNRAQIDSVSKL